MRDVFLYNGGIERREDLRFIEFVAENQKHDDLLLLLVTPGGNPDAAYKIGKYIQSKYANFTCFIPGLCKSAGTLLAIAANELVFAPYGELGPLDVQLTKTDDLFGQESGLNISEAFRTVETAPRAPSMDSSVRLSRVAAAWFRSKPHRIALLRLSRRFMARFLAALIQKKWGRELGRCALVKTTEFGSIRSTPI
jgi:ClpP class serine protease